MKNERIIKKGIFTTFIFVVCLVLFGALALNNTQKKVKANTPELYYFDIDTSHENYMGVILYVYDVANVDNNTCNLYLYKSMSVPPYSASTAYSNVEFLRYSQLDYDDYDAYIYYFTYPSITSGIGVMIHINTYHAITFDNDTQVEYDIYLPYYPTFKEYYDDGYENGYDAGYDRGYLSGLETGYDDGYENGYDAGYSEGVESTITQDWIISTIGTIGAFLEIEFFPGLTFGVILGVPFIISLAWFIIRMFRGGGGD